MLRAFIDHPDPASVPITALTKAGLTAWQYGEPAMVDRWLKSVGFKAEAGALALLPGSNGQLARVLVGLGDGLDWAPFAGLPYALPFGTYVLDEDGSADLPNAAALGWALGSYRFTRYKSSEREPAKLVWPGGCDRSRIERVAEGTTLIRDLVNTPANDLGPAELALAAEGVAETYGAEVRTIVGNDLLQHEFPTIHMVGRGSSRAPRLVDLHWGPNEAPKLTLVGKGVCFDSGGLDLKPSAGMLRMKKDMGGAAHALGLAAMIMKADLPVRLRVLIPAVENMVSGDAFRPLDVVRTRQGLTVEVGNTDAEGRLILCDALAAAQQDNPDLVIDFATLTGAARAALGPDLPALFCNNDDVAVALLDAAEREGDPLWRLPLYQPYAKQLKSPVADLNNIGDNGMGGAITAALFLQHFVGKDTPWVHLDLFAWNNTDRPGRPKGGEAMGLRAVYAFLEERYAEV